MLILFSFHRHELKSGLNPARLYRRYFSPFFFQLSVNSLLCISMSDGHYHVGSFIDHIYTCKESKIDGQGPAQGLGLEWLEAE